MKQNILKCALWGILFALAAAQAGAQAQPAWTNNGASPRFPAQTHLAAVGRGNSQQNADADAIAGIARIFSVSARVSTQLAESYREIVRNGVARSFGQTDMLNVIELATDVENLVAVSIGERWNDGRGNFVALAVMDKSAAILLYEERIRANQAVIRGLTTMSASERNTFDGFARYRVAAVFADMNVAIGEMLFVLGHVPWDPIPRGEQYMREPLDIRSAITIGVNIRNGNDRGAVVRDNFTRVFSEAGFRTGGASPRYMLNVDFSNLQNSQNPQGFVFTVMELSASLADTNTGAVLLPFNLNFRGRGALTVPDAENFALREAGDRILSEYAARLSEYLARLTPRL